MIRPATLMHIGRDLAAGAVVTTVEQRASMLKFMRFFTHKGNIAVPLLALAGLVFLAGSAFFGVQGNDATLADGVGGPAEASLAVVLGHDMSPSPAIGTIARPDRTPPLPLEELGPVFQPDLGPVEMRIRTGETLYDALAARDIAHGDIMALVKACKGFRDLTKVRTGERFRIHTAPDGGLRSFGFDLDIESYVDWVREGDTYVRHDGAYPVERLHKGISGTIDLSLYASLQDLGAPLALAAKLNDILGWDVDFSRDLRQGDTFRILYDEVWKDGEVVRTGAITAVEFVNRGKTRRAYLFTDADGKPGYYDPQGGNLQKQLMRAPLEYSRVSSKFSYKRFHPVLKRWMPHLGVDYAAPIGTPVRAGGDGTIVTAATKKGNGRYVHIRHNNREYETYYLHLSRFGKGIRKGVKVSQGEIIGYVGATGYATGPHLDYRVKRSGRFVDPRRLKLPAAAPVPAEFHDTFLAQGLMYDAALAKLPLGTPVTVPDEALATIPVEKTDVYAARELPAGLRALP